MSGLNKAGISLIVAVLIMAGMLTTMGQINNGGGGGGSGTVSANNGSANAIAKYSAAAGSTTVGPDANLDDGTTTANTLTYAGTAGIATPLYKSSGAGSPTCSGATNGLLFTGASAGTGITTFSGNAVDFCSNNVRIAQAIQGFGFVIEGTNNLLFNGGKGQHINPQAAGNDIAGTCTAAAATTCTVTFTTAYTAAPTCTVTDQTNITTAKALPSTTNLVITTSAASSDVFSYICIGNPN
jgi:hypothetical protein